jgi:iron-sulfur cluster assembly protein
MTMFTLSPTAAAEIRAAMPRSEAQGLALRVAARLEADGALAFGMGLDEAREGDLPLEIDGVSLLIAPPSQALLDDALLDYVEVAPGRHDFVCVAQTEDTPAPAAGCGSGGGCNGCAG